MNWYELAKAREQELLEELIALLQIESVLDETTASEEAPFGKGPKAALDFMLAKGKAQGFTVKNVDNMAGHIEMGEGEDLLGILCHVDVVPAGDLSTWTYPPFEGCIVDGKLYARGAIDDKGPTMAAWLGMKLVKDANVPLSKRVRMIIGTDEETDFRCVDRYFEKEEMPSIGFAPDADFPLINAEKGIAHVIFSSIEKPETEEQLISFKAGHRINMVPDYAEAVVSTECQLDLNAFDLFLENYKLSGKVVEQQGHFVVALKGKSSHAMEPEKGINAAVRLAQFLATQNITGRGGKFIYFLADVFGDNPYGEKLTMDYEDDMSGKMTLNPGFVTYDEKRAQIEISMRYSVTYDFAAFITKGQQAAKAYGMALDVASDSKPHYVPEDDELVATLLDIYRGVTGDMSKPLSTGGGTYARVMKKGVAFGMLYPGEPDVAHQADEFVVIENLVKAAAIYAEAIAKLAK